MIHEIASLPRKFTESEVIEHRLPNRGTNPRENVVPEQKVKLEQVVATTDEVFDRAHLGRYTMNDEGLEHEILSLFLTQLKATVEMIETANSAAEWKLWTHTLKGAAAAVGAWQLQSIAVALESLPFESGAEIRIRRLENLAGAANEFRQRIIRDYPQLAA